MNTITIVIVVVFAVGWWVAFTASFFVVDRPKARSSAVVGSNIIQAVFHILLPLVPMVKSFDRTLPRRESRAYQIFSISFLVLLVTAFLIEQVITG